MKPAHELQAMFSAAGVDLTSPLAATCGSGISATLISFAAHVATAPKDDEGGLLRIPSFCVWEVHFCGASCLLVFPVWVPATFTRLLFCVLLLMRCVPRSSTEPRQRRACVRWVVDRVGIQSRQPNRATTAMKRAQSTKKNKLLPPWQP